MRDPICVLANAGSGRKSAARIGQLIAPLQAAGLAHEVRLIRKGAQIPAAARKAREDGFATIIAAGGDGTICSVATELAGSDIALGILPLGTFNFFARSLGLDTDPGSAMIQLLAGVETQVAAGEVNGKLFLNNASLGLYPALLERREAAYARWGRSRLAAYWSGLRVLATYNRPSRMTLTIDGVVQVRHSPMIFIAQNAYQLEEYGMHEGVDLIRKGQLAVYIAPELRRWQLLGFALRIAVRMARPYRDFTLIGAEALQIETRARRRTIARDGEREKMAAPFAFRTLPGALTVIVPVIAPAPVPEAA
ncbi:MAG: diacylglycerol kinase family protein [Pseudotabrizicola sp.]|uniref:diacylglycerol/lipid kinase family protein n=1 Tax=Pseudotabrizicola sp. TaxID=2939647 RepID=UPI0027163F1D|nr:diacylglycerol kinase family protein [Pseudotabrizicola sp.]MDO9640216.1 diacylglycerol kinase family protein [Pseudotabrizicola sp.]